MTRVKDPDLDIVRYGAATSNGTAFFHVHVAGTMLGGGIPERLFKSPVYVGNGTSGGGATILLRRTGEDLLLMFLESNSSNPRGFVIGGIFADYLVEIRGEGGRITSKSVYSWQNRWILQPGILVNAAKDETDIEASLPISDLRGTQIVVQSTDWTSAGDTTIPLAAPSFSSPSDPLMRPFSTAAPLPVGFGGLTFYLRDTNPGLTSSDCSAVKGLETSQGPPAGTTISLTTGVKASFFTDPEISDETIAAGSWVASLDLSATGTVLNVTFAVTNQNGSSPSIICWFNRTTTAFEETFSCNAGDVPVLANQRIRLRIQYISGTLADLAYDGTATSNDSSMSVAIPEFGDVAPSAIAVGVLVLVLSFRRRRRNA